MPCIPKKEHYLDSSLQLTPCNITQKQASMQSDEICSFGAQDLKTECHASGLHSKHICSTNMPQDTMVSATTSKDSDHLPFCRSYQLSNSIETTETTTITELIFQ